MSRTNLNVLVAGWGFVALVFSSSGDAQVSAEVPASVLIFPKVEADGARDTVIQILNTGNPRAAARCFYLRGDDQTCTGVAFTITLFRQQPTHWVASKGRQPDPNDATCTRTNTACDGAGFDPGSIPAVPAGFRGALVCVQVDDSGVPFHGNNLIGVATVKSRASSDIATYNAIGVPGNPNADLPPVPNTLTLDHGLNNPNGQYDACPVSWSLSHVADGSQDELAGSGSTIQTSLTMLPCSLRLGQPTTVDVQLSVTDEFETTLSASTAVTCWVDAPLSSINSIFANLLTRNARTVITAPNGSGGVFVVSEEQRQSGPPSSVVTSSAGNLHREGLLFDASGVTDVIVLP